MTHTAFKIKQIQFFFYNRDILLFIFVLINTFQDPIRHVILNVYFHTRPGQFELHL